MSKWIKLNPLKLNVARKESIGGMKATVFLSPYDIPLAVRTFTDSDRHCVGLEFTYMDSNEPKVHTPPKGTVTFVLGKNSYRLYSLCVPADRFHQENTLYKKLQDALLQLEREGEGSPSLRIENYEVARKVIDEKKDDLLPAMLAVAG